MCVASIDAPGTGDSIPSWDQVATHQSLRCSIQQVATLQACLLNLGPPPYAFHVVVRCPAADCTPPLTLFPLRLQPPQAPPLDVGLPLSTLRGLRCLQLKGHFADSVYRGLHEQLPHMAAQLTRLSISGEITHACMGGAKPARLTARAATLQGRAAHAPQHLRQGHLCLHGGLQGAGAA